MVPKAVWFNRYAAINEFEQRLADTSVTIVKCFLHISREVQSERLLARLDDPTKYWKYNPADIDERGYWDSYQEAYSDAISTCNTAAAPWYVIPSDRKWYRNWAIASLLAQTLEKIDPAYPPADFDIETERRRILQS
jgi:polyphosphate kinase 2 (PPK2 family)